jgi:hypothetical protein
MIVKYPTGLYRDILPQRPEDRGNITFTISTRPPPRTNLVFPKVPAGVVYRKREITVLTVLERRPALGDLVFSISSARRLEKNNNAHQFEIGDLLEFSNTPLRTVRPMLVSQTTETRHDVNRLDFDGMGLTDTDQDTIAAASLQTQDRLTALLNDLKQRRADAEARINVQQKTVNEINRTIKALQVVDQDQDVQGLINKLTVRRDAAYRVRDQAVTEANALAAEADGVVTQLRAVATMLK